MGFLKGLGSGVGHVFGDVVGGAVKIVGDVTGSKFIDEIGEGVKQASYFAGDKLGEAASGTWDVASGIITQDETKMNDGFSDLGSAVSGTLKAAGSTVVNVVENGSNVIGGIANNDDERLKEGAKGLVKFGVVGALAFGIVDLADGPDGGGESVTTAETTPTSEQPSVHSPSVPVETTNEEQILVENPNTHHVEPHERTLASGEVIWVDGDGDSSVNTTGGWEQTNPDYRVNS